jgi:hypothetical protein
MAKNSGTDLIVKSIGVCLAQPNDKKKPSKVAIAYRTSDGVKFIFIKEPKAKATKDTFLSAIAEAEGVKNVTYVCCDGLPKDIYVCREDKGVVTDIVERDYAKNRFVDGFTEVFASQLRFAMETSVDLVKSIDQAFNATISLVSENDYVKGSYEYALINAYNACLLGCVFEREELQMETRGGQKVKFEFRKNNTAFLVSDTLFIYPQYRGLSECIDYYITEEFRYNDGEMHKMAYKIIYASRLNDYNLVRD